MQDGSHSCAMATLIRMYQYKVDTNTVICYFSITVIQIYFLFFQKNKFSIYYSFLHQNNMSIHATCCLDHQAKTSGLLCKEAEKYSMPWPLVMSRFSVHENYQVRVQPHANVMYASPWCWIMPDERATCWATHPHDDVYVDMPIYRCRTTWDSCWLLIARGLRAAAASADRSSQPPRGLVW